MCGGCAAGVFAYAVHLIQVCACYECVRLLCVGAMLWLWRTLLRFGYMSSTWPTAGKYGNYRGFIRLLRQLWYNLVPPGEKHLHFFITLVHQGYLLRISYDSCLSGNVSDSAKVAGTPQLVSDTQTVGGTGSVGWSMQTGAEWRLVVNSDSR